MKRWKVSFPTIKDLINEAQDSIRVVTISKVRNAKAHKSSIPYKSFIVLATAVLKEGGVGEYAYMVGEEISYFQERVIELAKASEKVEKEVIAQIERAGKKVLPGQYTTELVLGVRP
ncbi:MAG TPA: hypothetical protein VHT73_12910 [Thermodesulfobacteriota bacterium]|nr:hypothetical protein [Thermodesulfobacteriota bacterium]